MVQADVVVLEPLLPAAASMLRTHVVIQIGHGESTTFEDVMKWPVTYLIRTRITKAWSPYV